MFRASIPPTRRRHVNDEALANALEAMGFYIASLSRLSIAEQIRLFAGARFIIAPHGAGLTNLVFCDPNCCVYELAPEHYQHPYFTTIAHSRSLNYSIDAFQSLEGDGRHYNDWLVDIERVKTRVCAILESVT